jgi:hypothetical protein
MRNVKTILDKSGKRVGAECDQPTATQVRNVHQPKPLNRHPRPTKPLSIFQSCQKILKTSQNVKNDQIIANIVSFFKVVALKSPKIKLSG